MATKSKTSNLAKKDLTKKKVPATATKAVKALKRPLAKKPALPKVAVAKKAAAKKVLRPAARKLVGATGKAAAKKIALKSKAAEKAAKVKPAPASDAPQPALKIKLKALNAAPAGEPKPKASSAKKRLNPNNLIPSNLGPIDMALEPSKRRMGGFDIERFRARHQLKILDVVYALALHPYPHLQKTMRMETLPYPTELLIRLYDLNPGPAPWRQIKPKDLFNQFYGEELEKFKATDWAQSAQLAMYRRFAALFSRDVATTYRWMQGGEVRVDIQMIMSKLSDSPNPRELLEEQARLTWSYRGLDFDKNFPMPTLEDPPMLKARGRKRKPMTLSKG